MAEDLIELTVDCETFENIIMNNQNQEVFVTFIDYCLVHLRSSVNWHYKMYNTCI